MEKGLNEKQEEFIKRSQECADNYTKAIVQAIEPLFGKKMKPIEQVLVSDILVQFAGSIFAKALTLAPHETERFLMNSFLDSVKHQAKECKQDVEAMQLIKKVFEAEKGGD